jgi:hypothetical protein
MDVKVHVQGIKGSSVAEPGEKPSALFGAILEVDGHIIEMIHRVEVVFEEGFMDVRAHLIPGTFEVIPHDKDSWPALLRALEEERTMRDGTGRLVARMEKSTA